MYLFIYDMYVSIYRTIHIIRVQSFIIRGTIKWQRPTYNMILCALPCTKYTKATIGLEIEGKKCRLASVINSRLFLRQIRYKVHRIELISQLQINAIN